MGQEEQHQITRMNSSLFERRLPRLTGKKSTCQHTYFPIFDLSKYTRQQQLGGKVARLPSTSHKRNYKSKISFQATNFDDRHSRFCCVHIILAYCQILFVPIKLATAEYCHQLIDKSHPSPFIIIISSLYLI